MLKLLIVYCFLSAIHSLGQNTPMSPDEYIQILLTQLNISEKYDHGGGVFLNSREKEVTGYQISNESDNHKRNKEEKPTIFIAVVACGYRFIEALNSMKSAIIFSRSPLFFFVFTDGGFDPEIDNTLAQWKDKTNNKFDYELREVQFPKEYFGVWLNLYGMCAAAKLFIPSILPHLDSILYVDADTIWLGPPEELWQHFDMLNPEQVAALGDDPSAYPKQQTHPVFGLHGLNSGVILMNLTRMREMRWESRLNPSLIICNGSYYPDQDIINLIFNKTPSAVATLPCRFNYRMDHCRGDRNTLCPSALYDGVLLVHGTGRAFEEAVPYNVYQAIFNATSVTDVSDNGRVLANNLRIDLKKVPKSKCKNTFMIVFAKMLQKMLKATKENEDSMVE